MNKLLLHARSFANKLAKPFKLSQVLIQVLIILPIAGQAQTRNELGKPFLTAWLPKDYDAEASNWAIVQDDRGVMYFGNTSGILEYDGVSWRLIQFPNKSICRSLAKDADGRIYAGGVGDFGYLAPDNIGQMRFVSLLPQVKEDVRDFADVWVTLVLRDSAYFVTDNFLFRWTPSGPSLQGSALSGEMKIWRPLNTFHLAFVVDEVIYIREREKGLLRLQGDSLQLVPGGEQFANERIYVMLPFPAIAADSSSSAITTKAGIQQLQSPIDSTGRGADAKRKIDLPNPILIGSRPRGLSLYDGLSLKPFKTEADKYLQENALYLPGVALRKGNFLLNTLNGGAVLLDRRGKLLQTLDRSSGLPDNAVYYAYSNPARPETQWLAFDNGIACVEVAGPVSFFDAERGLESSVRKITRHRGVLYVATNVGVSYLDAAAATFKPIDMPAVQAWDFLALNGQLLVATNEGVYAINGKQAKLIRPSRNNDFNAAVFHRSKQDDQRVFVGINGLASLRWENGVWRDEGRAPGVQDEIRSLVETDDGTLWAGTYATGVLRLTFPSNRKSIWEEARVERFGPEQGLPMGWMAVYEINHTTYFSSLEKIYRFDLDRQRFVVDSTFMVTPPQPGWLLNEDENGRVWSLGRGIALGTRHADGNYQWLKAPFQRFSTELASTVYTEANGVVWFGGNNGLIRYDSNREMNEAADYPALVRRVVVGQDSLIFGGAGRVGRPSDPTLSYAHNNLRFAYSASSFEDASRLQFQTWLEGFDKAWSNWNGKNEKEYTNLPEGDYQFRVRAKNVYEHVSQEAVYSFSILPPWYRSWWAYGGYAIVCGLLVFAADRVQRRRLLKKERERAEAERKELELKKAAELKIAYEKLTEAHEHLKNTQQQLVTQEKLASLGQLTAGIAHEIKNPLNFVNNFAQLSAELTDEFVEQLNANADKTIAEVRGALEELLSDLRMNNVKINEHGKRADSIVRAMMQHARGGKGERQPTDVNKLVEEYVNLTYHGMRAKVPDFNVSIKQDFGELDGKIELVPQDIGRVLLNLLGNAFDAVRERAQKTDGTYSPMVSVSTRSVAARVEIRVRDNGGGIPDEVREKIFEPFFTTKPAGSGTGLGLSLSYDIVTQGHGGTLTVESTKGEGATFIINLPAN